MSNDTEPTDVQYLAPEDFAWLIMRGHIHTINRTNVTIGRSLENDIVLQDECISREHARITHEDGHFVLYDLCSKGGIAVNFKRIERTILKMGDIIQFAQVRGIFIEDKSIINETTQKETGNLDKNRGGCEE